MSERKYSGPPPKTKIFVGQIPEDADPSELRKLFEQYGEVTECDIIHRYGFVHMKNEEMALKAIKELNDVEFMGSQLSVQQSTGRSRRGGRGGGRRGSRGSRSSNRGHPYMRSYDRGGPGMRNGFYDDFYSDRAPQRMYRDPIGYDDMHGEPFGRAFPSVVGRSRYDRMSYGRDDDYDSPSMDDSMYRRRSPLRSSYGSGRGYW